MCDSFWPYLSTVAYQVLDGPEEGEPQQIDLTQHTVKVLVQEE